MRYLYPVNNTCATHGEPLAVQGRVVGSWIPYNHTNDVFKRIDNGFGLSCINEEQSDGQCENYEVRYCCYKGK